LVSIGKILIYGLIGAFAISSLINPQKAFATTQAFGGVGTALGSLGGGIQSLLTGTGTGISKLFNPLFTLRDLIYGPSAGLQTEKDVREITSTGQIQTNTQETQQIQTSQIYTPSQQGAGFKFRSIPSIGPVPVAQTIVHGQNLPLSTQAIKYYQEIGISVTPNAGGVASASANYSAGAAQKAGYSRGPSR